MTWGIVAAAGASLVGGIMQSGAQQDAQNQQNQYSQQDQELNFQRQDYLAQQQRAWQLQDRQFKAQSMAEFASKWNGNQAGITPVNQNAEMSQLDKFDPNALGSVGASGTPGNSLNAPSAGSNVITSPLGQLQPGKTP